MWDILSYRPALDNGISFLHAKCNCVILGFRSQHHFHANSGLLGASGDLQSLFLCLNLFCFMNDDRRTHLERMTSRGISKVVILRYDTTYMTFICDASYKIKVAIKKIGWRFWLEDLDSMTSHLAITSMCHIHEVKQMCACLWALLNKYRLTQVCGNQNILWQHWINNWSQELQITHEWPQGNTKQLLTISSNFALEKKKI